MSFGAFGKIPALGDFFRIALGPGFVDPWDAFLQRAMVTGRSTLGPRWQDCYLTAPIWRFTLAPGLAGPSGMLGVVMPSVDRVGRQFPLTLAVPVEGSALALHLASGPTFEALEAVALDALDDAFGRDALAEALAAVPLPQPVHGAPAAVMMRPGLCTATAGDVRQLPLALALSAIPGAGRAVFSAGLEGASLFLASEGLPVDRVAAALFDPADDLWLADAGVIA